MHQIYPLNVSWVLFGNAQKRLGLSCVNAAYLVRHLYGKMHRSNVTDYSWYFAGVFAFSAHLSKRLLSSAGVPYISMGTWQRSSRSSRWPFYAGIVFLLLYTLHEGYDITVHVWCLRLGVGQLESFREPLASMYKHFQEKTQEGMSKVAWSSTLAARRVHPTYRTINWPAGFLALLDTKTHCLSTKVSPSSCLSLFSEPILLIME